MSAYHQPVLLQESIDLLAVKPGGIYVDVTFGGGGHTKELLSRVGEGTVVAFDRDPDAQQNVPDDERMVFIAEDFKFFYHALAARKLLPVDGILGDLGISSHQIDTPERGFSHRFDAPLDMRMNPETGASAADLLQEAEEMTLVHWFSRYGEVTNARKLARALVAARQRSPIRTTRELLVAIESCIPRNRQAKYLSQVYQALRIVVNDELGALEALLLEGLQALKPGGRMSVIAYHSLEDRLVKRFFRSGKFSGKDEKDFYGHSLSPWQLITRRAIQASPQEIEQNPRARSARLRAAEKRE
jgi:16S rRNA (cytosine1402-N4)-methyltransferase